LLAVVFVLPTIRACDGSLSPLDFGLQISGGAVMVWPVFVIAAMLVILTLGQRADGPHAEPARAVLAAPVLTWLASVWPTMMIAEESARSLHRTLELTFVAFAWLVLFPLSIGGFVGALRARGWTRWRRAIGSFVAATWLTYPAQYILGCLFVPAERHGLLFGAYVFVAAMVWLSLAAARRDQTDGRLPPADS
jgi:hypothetical protein